MKSLNIAYEVRKDSTILIIVVQGLDVDILPRLAAEPLPTDVHVNRLPVYLERVIGIAVVANVLQTLAVFASLDILKGANQLALEWLFDFCS